MTWNFANLPAAAALLALTLMGCASSGPSGPAPIVTDPMRASNVTLYRNGSLVGLWSNIRVRLDGRDLVRLAPNQHFSFAIDPGEYLLDFSMGFNECRRAMLIRPGHSYRYRLAPNCLAVEDWQ